MAKFKVDELMKTYVGLRDAIDAHQKEFKAWKADLESKMELIAMHLFEACTALGTDAVKGGGYTAFKTNKTFLNINDKQEFSEFIVGQILNELSIDPTSELVEQVLDSGALDFATIKAAKKNCIEYKNQNDVPPPGTKFTEETVIQVRKS